MEMKLVSLGHVSRQKANSSRAMTYKSLKEKEQTLCASQQATRGRYQDRTGNLTEITVSRNEAAASMAQTAAIGHPERWHRAVENESNG